jgi:hypothetical protein
LAVESVSVGAFFKQNRIDIHKQLESVVYKTQYCLVPMSFAISIKWRKDNRKDDFDILCHQANDVFIIPII